MILQIFKTKKFHVLVTNNLKQVCIQNYDIMNILVDSLLTANKYVFVANTCIFCLNVVVGCGWFWMVVDGCGCCGWLWMVLDGCGWLWMVVIVVDGCGWF